MSTLELENIKHPDNSGNNIALNSNGSMVVDRQSTDGTITDFRKSGTTVGKIGVNNSDNFTVQGNSGHSGIEFGTNAIFPHKNSANVDNTIDLGEGGLRWKDLYLSGGVYLGGTGSANKLDDYEEGTFTPGNPSSNIQVSSSGRYVKIGCVVHIWMEVLWEPSASGSTKITGLPFTVTNESWAGNIAITNIGRDDVLFFAHNNGTSAYFRNSSNTDFNASDFSNDFIYVSATYRTT
jgi:hypothetical protein